MRVLVTGSAGFLGRHLVRLFSQGGDSFWGPFGCQPPVVIAACRRSGADTAGVASVRLDITNAAECERIIGEQRPTHIVHTAAMSQTGECEKEPELARITNAVAVRNLADAASALEQLPYLLHISTDLVFDGSRGNYREQDETAPVQVYGRTKLEGESEAQRYPGPHSILRSALIYGPATPLKSCFLQWTLRDIAAGTATLFTDEYRNPIWVDDLARVIAHLCAHQTEGMFHCGGPQTLSRFEFGKFAAAVYGLALTPQMGRLRKDFGLEQTRPKDVSLNYSKLQHIAGFEPTPILAALRKIRENESTSEV